LPQVNKAAYKLSPEKYLSATVQRLRGVRETRHILQTADSMVSELIAKDLDPERSFRIESHIALYPFGNISQINHMATKMKRGGVPETRDEIRKRLHGTENLMEETAQDRAFEYLNKLADSIRLVVRPVPRNQSEKK
jgi:hypothetical protein